MPGEAWAYFDTSALVKCYVEERGSARALELVERHAVLSSVLAAIELTGALRRQEAARQIAPQQRQHALRRFLADRSRFTLLQLDARVAIRAEALVATEPVRTLDALHLASALVFQAETRTSPPFITGDVQQHRTAQALGFDAVLVG